MLEGDSPIDSPKLNSRDGQKGEDKGSTNDPSKSRQEHPEDIENNASSRRSNPNRQPPSKSKYRLRDNTKRNDESTHNKIIFEGERDPGIKPDNMQGSERDKMNGGGGDFREVINRHEVSIVINDDGQKIPSNVVGRGEEVRESEEDNIGVIGVSRTVGTRTSLNSMKSMNLDYFTDDEVNALQREKAQSVYFFYESEVNFSVAQYIEFFIYHLTYFLLLGPFILIFSLISKKYRILFHNLRFDYFIKTGWLMILYWLSSSSIIFGFAYMNYIKNKWPSINLVLLKAAILGIVLRSTSIAGKYATFPSKLIQKIKEVKLTSKEIEAEFMLFGWLEQNSEIRAGEIYNSTERNEIDRSVLQINFMSRPSQSSIDGLELIRKEREDAKEIAKVWEVGNKINTYYNAEYLFELLLKHYNSKPKYKTILTTGFFVSVIWGVFPVILRVSSGLKPQGENSLEIVIQYVSLFVGFNLFFIQFVFYRQAIVDLNRKLFLMRQFFFMISPRHLDKSEFKLLPTIDLLDQISLQSWLRIRRIGMDYGRKYFYRHEIFLPVTIIIMVVSLLGMIFILYALGPNTDSLYGIEKVEWSMLFFSFGIDGLASMIASFHFMYSAGALNDEFDMHIECLEKNRLYFKDLINLKEFYFGDQVLADPSNMREIFHSTTSSKLRKKLCKEILLRFPCSTSDLNECLPAYIESIIKIYDELLECINHDKVYDHVRILGFSVSKSGTLNSLFALLSIIFGSYQIVTGNG